MNFKGLVGRRVALCEDRERDVVGFVVVPGIFYDAPLKRRPYIYSVFTTFGRPVGDAIAYFGVNPDGVGLSVVGRETVIWVPAIDAWGYGGISRGHPFYQRLRRMFETARKP